MMKKARKQFDEAAAIRMLRISGIDDDNPDYQWLLTVLTNIMIRATARSNAISRIGLKIVNLVESQPVSSAARAEIRRLGELLAADEPSGGDMLQVCRGFVALAKSSVVEASRQSSNRDREEKERNRLIGKRFNTLTKTMSQRAAARVIRSEMQLRTITEERIRKIGAAAQK